MDVARTHRLVVIGASAGGLQALIPITSGLRPNRSSSYVVAHHMAPNQESGLVGLLARQAALPVREAVNGQRLVPDEIYVCPPGHEIAVVGLHLVVGPRDPSLSISPSVDRLFQSAASHQGHEVVALVLSGTGRDGVRGCEAVRAAGGVVLAQSPDQAPQPGMPQAVIDAGQADLVGTCEQIVHWLVGDKLNGAADTADIPDDDDAAGFEAVYRLVSDTTGLDLSHYKPSTLQRRTVRRYQSLGLPSLAAYLQALQMDPEEVTRLQQAYMISVTAYFRDADAFESLARMLRDRAAHAEAGDTFRAWVAGCATGEEAYSVAMILAETLEAKRPAPRIRVFATDIDRAALDHARSGEYAEAELADLPPVRRERWFERTPTGWRVRTALREMCVFSEHNLIAYPPFIRMDLISCRNVLIYFRPEQQRQLMRTFHYALNPRGMLLLGRTEAVAGEQRLYTVLDAEQRLFMRSDELPPRAPRPARTAAQLPGPWPRTGRNASSGHRRSLLDAALGEVARQFGPPAVLVNQAFEPLQFLGGAQRYFTLPDDNPEFNVFSLCRAELRSELKTLGYRLVQEGAPTLSGLPVAIELENGQVLRVRPAIHRIELPGPQNGDGAMLITFEELTAPRDGDAAAPAQVEAELPQLRRELADTREHLQAVIEELEAANEELQALNEEVQCSTEEIQSANEELQSSNEELTTLNDELSIKSQEAGELSTTLANIQNSLGASLVVVDREGRITRFNALATRVFGIVAKDVGSFLYGVPCHLHLPHLRDHVNDVIARGASKVERVHQGKFHYLMQIDPYRDDREACAGAVLTFLDISELHRAEQAQQRSEARFRRIWESSMEGLLVCDREGVIVMANPALEQIFQYPQGELIGKPVETLVLEDERGQHRLDRAGFQAEAGNRRMAPLRELSGRRRDGTALAIEISLSSMQVDDEQFVVASVSDVSLRRMAEQARRQGEQRLRLALDAANAGTWEWDLATNANRWSDELWSLYGLADRSIVPSFEAWKESIAPEHMEQCLAAVAEGVRRNAEFELVWRVRSSDPDQPRWLMARGRPQFDGQDKPVRYIGIVVDISARKRIEADLERHRDHLERTVAQRTAELSELYNDAPCGYHSIDDQGTFVSVNDTELSWLGYTREEMIGRMRAQDVMSPDCRDAFTRNFPRLVETGTISDLALEFVRKDGSIMPVLLNATAKYDDQGRFSHSLSTILDDTQRRQAQEMLVKARQAAEAASEAKSSFLANMSHEIRTPLNTVIGVGHILRRGPLDESQKTLLHQLDSASQHLLSVIDNILDLSKIEAGHLELFQGVLDLGTLGAELIDMLRPRAAEKGMALELEVERMDCAHRGDPTRLTQALLNLAGNALKFTDHGHVRVRIRRLAREAGRDLVRFEVEDTGIGVSAETRARLFRPFEQGDASLARAFGGTGLGLAITRSLAEMMGGSVGVEEVEGGGSRFWFSAWLESVALDAAQGEGGPRGSLAHASAEEVEETLRREFGGRRLILAEDDPVNRELALFFLNQAGLAVTVAENGRQVLDLAREGPVDLVLMDMQMPEIDGLEATRRLRALPGWKKVPIVALTANAFDDDRRACLAAGMNDFVTKPMQPAQLYAALLRWLRQRSGPRTTARQAKAAPGADPQAPLG